jgi:hypothetical protein
LGGAIGSDQPTLQTPHSENVMTDTSTNTPKARPVSFSPEELQRVIAEAVAAATAQAKAEFAQALAAKPSATINGKSDQSAKNEAATIRAFKRAGFGSVKPHEDAKTFNRWLAAGYRPVEKSKAVRVNNLRLFCKAQVRPLTEAEKKAMAALPQPTKAATKRTSKGSVIPLNGGAPQ